MNIFAIFSVLLAIGIFFTGLRLASEDLKIFIDFPSMFIVFGGSFAATAISFHLTQILKMIKVFGIKIVKGRKTNYTAVVVELIQAIDAYKNGKPLTTVKEDVKDFFFRECLEIIDDGILSKEEALEVIELRKNKIISRYVEDSSQLKAIGKYPPAFGMVGTTIGMIVLLANLGGEDAMKMIGPAMGVCLITTLYGAALANVLLIPMADNLTQSSKEVYNKNEIIIEGVKLIMSKSSPVLAAERLNSFLTPSERVNWKDILQR